jgi:diadenosine tetraphosphate (Ap4A) HIT family hydrolase
VALEARSAYQCEVFSFELWLPVARLSCSSLGLYDDSRFPGRCILVLHEHAEDITAIGRTTSHQFTDDIQRGGRAILAQTGAQRLNVAVLGNVEHHLHAHLIPRFADEPYADRSPWEHPSPSRPLPPAERHELMTGLARWLVQHAEATS